MEKEEFSQFQVTLTAEWMRAEEFLKKSERISNEVLFPSIKELRYAARRYFQALDEQSKAAPTSVIRTHLDEALENCRKARHDAIDASIAFIHGEMDLLIKKAGLDVVAASFPDFAELKIEMAEVSEIIVASRKDRESIDGKYEKILENHLDKIVRLYLKLETSREVIASVRRRNRREFWLGVVLVGAVIGIVTGSAVLYSDKRGWFDRFKPTESTGKLPQH